MFRSYPPEAESGGLPDDTSLVTVDNETTELVNSRQLVDGVGTQVNVSTPGEIKVDVDVDATIQIIFDGGGAVIASDVQADLVVPFDCTITSATLLADVTGSIVIDIWADILGNYPPTDSESITSSSPPTISNDVKSSDTSLTGWTTSLVAGNTIRFNVDSCTSIKRVTLCLGINRS